MDAITVLKGDHAYVQKLFKFMVLAEDVRHHVKEEEASCFASCAGHSPNRSWRSSASHPAACWRRRQLPLDMARSAGETAVRTLRSAAGR